jgi:chromosome segregation ATPase
VVVFWLIVCYNQQKSKNPPKRQGGTSMAATYNFRTAINGFNREDVVHYIEYIISKHSAQVNQLRSDLSAAQQECATLKAQPKHDPAKEEELLRLQQTVAELNAAKAALEAQLAEVNAQLTAALDDQVQAQRRNEEELEAYRRAERMERQAKERTEAMYQKANGVLADATTKIDNASAQINGIADQVAAQLTVLQQAVTGSKIALKDAAASLYTIRLSTED